MVGIRESQGTQGKPFNLRQAEIIIGQGVTNAINGIMDVSQAVEYINRRIKNETGAWGRENERASALFSESLRVARLSETRSKSKVTLRSQRG